MISVAEMMKGRTTLSLEIFPPKTPDGAERLGGELLDMMEYSPQWISCTCGASGTELDSLLQHHALLELQQLVKPTVVAHYTCIHRSYKQILDEMDQLLSMGIDHVLALRGDFQKGEDQTHGCFAHATDLISALKNIYGSKLHLSCAGFPEGHIQSENFADDIAFLKRKQDLGAEYIVTQLTFDMEAFKRWREALDKARITIPVSAGVMPVTVKEKLLRHCLSQNGCAIPTPLARLISRCYDDPVRFREEGMDFGAKQIQEYISLGVNDVHIYTLNDASVTNELIMRSGFFKKSLINEENAQC